MEQNLGFAFAIHEVPLLCYAYWLYRRRRKQNK